MHLKANWEEVARNFCRAKYMINKKYLLTLALLFVGALFFYDTSFASSGPDLIVKKAEQVTEVVVDIVRGISYAIALISVVMLGIKFFSGGVHAMVEAKMTLIALIIALFIIFNGETIVGLIFKAVK
ncbi:MAG: TrbC/VirB2 family protein [Bacillales bacterium]|nr:TrbC/VirB2 family protein [Bacillales bacterium]